MITAGTVATMFCAVPASAVPDGDPDGGLWYFTKTGLVDANAAGVHGEGVSVAIIDSQINTSIPELQGADLAIHEPALCQAPPGWPNPGEMLPATSSGPDAEHGTVMASLIAGNGRSNDSAKGIQGVAPGVRVLYYATAVDGGGNAGIVCPQGEDHAYTHDYVSQAINLATDDGADIISISLHSGSVADVKDAIARATAMGIVIVVGIGNDASVPPGLAQANGVVTVQMSDPAGEIVPSNVVSDPEIDIVSPGGDIEAYNAANGWTHQTITGTSAATAITAGALALIMSSNPGATPFQALQALLRNTDDYDHPFGKEDTGYWGYGPMNITRALAVDATQYPDENPLVDPGAGGPSIEEIEAYKNQPTASSSIEPSAETSTRPSTQATPSPSQSASSPDSSSNLGLIVGIVAAVVVIAAVTVVIIIRGRQRTR